MSHNGIGTKKREVWRLNIWFIPPFLYKCLYQVRVITVFKVFQLLTDFFLFIYFWVLTFPLEDCSEFGNFVIILILSWIFKVLAHCNIFPCLDSSLHSDILCWFRVNQPLILILNTAANTNFSVFGLTRPRFKSTIYRTGSEHPYNYTIDAVCMTKHRR